MADSPQTQTLPVVKSVIHSRTILHLVRDNFGIDDPSACTLIKSMNNDVYRIKALSGPSIFKIYGRGLRKSSEICWESDLLRHLAANNVAAPRIFPTVHGDPFLTVNAPEGVRLGALYEELPGRWPAPTGNPKLYHALGQFTGELYNKSDDFVSVHQGRTLDLKRLIRQGRALINSLQFSQPAERKSMLELLGEAEHQLSGMIQGGLDWGVCHGDLALHNVYMLTDGSMVFLDFENAGNGWRAADLCALRHELRRMRDGWEAFKEGFRERRPLPEPEIIAIDWMLVPFCLYSLRWELKMLPNLSDRRDEHVAWVLKGLREWADRELLGS
jgi:Ser/Thr protein kinase RdoA (MazF antagonist)